MEITVKMGLTLQTNTNKLYFMIKLEIGQEMKKLHVFILKHLTKIGKIFQMKMDQKIILVYLLLTEKQSIHYGKMLITEILTA